MADYALENLLYVSVLVLSNVVAFLLGWGHFFIDIDFMFEFCIFQNQKVETLLEFLNSVARGYFLNDLILFSLKHIVIDLLELVQGDGLTGPSMNRLWFSFNFLLQFLNLKFQIRNAVHGNSGLFIDFQQFESVFPNSVDLPPVVVDLIFIDLTQKIVYFSFEIIVDLVSLDVDWSCCISLPCFVPLKFTNIFLSWFDSQMSKRLKKHSDSHTVK